MTLEPIALNDFSSKNFKIFDKTWFVLTAGNFAEKHFNCLTISWGMMGTMWEKPIVEVVVRPTRYTYSFMEGSVDFTICAFPEKYRKALGILGAKSGRDGDKIGEAGLTPCTSSLVSSPSFTEANLVFECRKIYADDFRPEMIIDREIEKEYPIKDYHRFYIGEVLAILGASADPPLFEYFH